MPPSDPSEHELAQSLAALVQQIDVSDYRDSLGQALRDNIAFRHGQVIVDRFGVSHADICRALDRWGDDLARAARSLNNLGRARGEDGQRPPRGAAHPPGMS